MLNTPVSEKPKPDKFKATWVSHSSIADFLKCQRLYYLRNVYKDSFTKRKFTIMTPPLALGQCVHEVVEGLSLLPSEERLAISLVKKFEIVWMKVEGKQGGFKSNTEEQEYKERGVRMLKRIEENPGPILNKAIKIRADGGLPYYWLNEDDNIILCGKVDWIEYLPDDTVHIIDFKTGKNEEDADSLQLPIYLLLAMNTQKRQVSKASYWYLDSDIGLVEKKMPDPHDAYQRVSDIARRIMLARKIGLFKCAKGGCFACRPFERILAGEGEKVALSEYGQDIFILP